MGSVVSAIYRTTGNSLIPWRHAGEQRIRTCAGKNLSNEERDKVAAEIASRKQEADNF